VTVPVPRDDPAALGATFLAAHRARHGHADPAQPIQLVNLRVVAARPARVAVASAAGRTKAVRPRAIVTRDGNSTIAEVWALGQVAAGTHVRGPAILAGLDATALVEPGWHGVVHPSGAVILERT
jgi:N-methylhydantoinase A